MTRNPSLHASSLNDHSVFVAHCDYGKKGFEALVDMAMTRGEVVSRIASADFGFEGVIRVDEYNVAEGWARDVTEDILREAGKWEDVQSIVTAQEAARAFPREMV